MGHAAFRRISQTNRFQRFQCGFVDAFDLVLGQHLEGAAFHPPADGAEFFGNRGGSAGTAGGATTSAAGGLGVHVGYLSNTVGHGWYGIIPCPARRVPRVRALRLLCSPPMPTC